MVRNHSGGHPIDAAKSQTYPSPNRFHHTLRHPYNYLAAAHILPTQHQRSSRHESSIADECGYHSVMPMDLDNATLSTSARPKGWTLDSPIITRAQKIFNATLCKGTMTLELLVHGMVHMSAQGRTFPVHYVRHKTPFLSKSKDAQEPPHGGPCIRRTHKFSVAPPKAGSVREGNISSSSCFRYNPCFNIHSHVTGP